MKCPFCHKAITVPGRVDYSRAFDSAWALYGRKENKKQAYEAWRLATRDIPEDELLTRIVGALLWQGDRWAAEGWKFAPHFVRYLRQRRWEDEQTKPTVPVVANKPVPAIEREVAATAANLAKLRASAPAQPPTREQLAALRGAK